MSSGSVAEGDRLPAIRALAEKLGVHRSTIQMAYRELESAGLVESRVGSGTRARRPGGGTAAVQARSPRAAGAPWRPRFTRAAEEACALLISGEEQGREPAGGIDFSKLVPDVRDFPVGPFEESIGRALASGGAALLDYGAPGGFPRLREILAERETRAGTPTTPEQILVTTGAQQGIELAVRAFAGPGEAVVLSSPTYHQMFGILRSLGVEALGVPESAGGMDAAGLGRALRTEGAALVYAMPNFQNPTGRTWDRAARDGFLERTADFAGPVLEDDFERELRFTGEHLPTLRSLCAEPRVISLGTVSKALFPGVRVGWIAAERIVIDRIGALKHYSDLSSGILLQAALADFIERGEYDRHLVRVRASLERKHAAAREALQRHLADFATWTEPEGGYTLWVQFPERVDSRMLAREVRDQGVQVAPGFVFDPDGSRSSGIRLALPRADEEEIGRGIEIVARVARRQAERQTAPSSVFL